MTVPRQEIVSFSMLMEERMAANDAEKGDSWKTMEFTKLGGLAIDRIELFLELCKKAADAQESEMKALKKDARKLLVDMSNFNMMLYRRIGENK
ncbi:MAG: hypothetical protein ACE5IJ_10985 [Thermoplasmata archaeon]